MNCTAMDCSVAVIMHVQPEERNVVDFLPCPSTLDHHGPRVAD